MSGSGRSVRGQGSDWAARRKRFRATIEPLEDRRVLAATITVNSTLDTNARDAVITLREAISISNRTLTFASLSATEKALVTGTSTNADADTIQFSIPVTDAGHVYYKDDGISGQITLANVMPTAAANDGSIGDIDPDWAHSWFTIRPTTLLPSTLDPVTIDGYTQSGATANTNTVGLGLNTVLKIEIDGTNEGTVASNLRIEQGVGTVVRGLVLNRAFSAEIYNDFGANNAVIAGNFLGTDISGTRAFSQTQPDPPAALSSGLWVDASGITIGGTAPAARNLISGNNLATSNLVSAIILRGHAAPSTVQGNIIGPDKTGTVVLGNRGSGILVDSPNDVIGGATASAGNVISGNQNVSINLGSLNAVGTLIQNNKLGTDPSGTLAVGTTGGISIVNTASNNRILDNTIAFGSGIHMATGSTGNLISRNSIFSNTGPGIDLGNGGVSRNDVPPASDPPDQDTGPNLLQNFPVLTSVAAIAGGTRIQGTLSSTPSSQFRLEFFANAERDENTFSNLNDILPGEFGEGQTYIGLVDVSTNSSGVATFSVDLAVNLLSLPGAGGQPFVTSTATDITLVSGSPKSNSSEFSAVVPLGGPSLVVTNTGDTGLGTLREAIINANLSPVPQTITFDIPATDARHFYYQDDGIDGQVSLNHVVTTTAGDDSAISDIDPDWAHSWFSIQPTRELPEIIDSVIIDGYSQNGSAVNTLPAPQGLNTVLTIELDGSQVAGNGLTIGFNPVNGQDQNGSTIEGLAINRFGANGVEFTGGAAASISGNFIGVDVSGTLELGNGGNGILLTREAGDSIGGLTADMRNIISGSGLEDISLANCGGIEIQGNLIGLDKNITQSFGLGLSALLIVNSKLVTMGGADPAATNIVGRNSPVGIVVDPPTSSIAAQVAAHATVNPADPDALPSECIDEYRNLLQAKRDLNEANKGDDIDAQLDALQAVDLAETFLKSCISQHTADISVAALAGWFTGLLGIKTDSLVKSAASTSGDYLAIDIGGDGISANDPGDQDAGPNNLRNFPTLTGASSINEATTVTGTYNGIPNADFRIEFYVESVGTNFRAGEQFLGFVNVTTNATGNASFTFHSPVNIPVGQFVTSTATRFVDDDNNTTTPAFAVDTSEFSPVVAVTDTPTPTATQVTVLGAERGSDTAPRVKVLEAKTGVFISTFLAYESNFHGGVRVATGDLNGDGVPEIITAPGAGRAGLVKVFDLAGNELTGFQTTPYPSSFKGGVFVAVADVNGDGRLDLITTPDKGRSAEVRVYFNRFNTNPTDGFTGSPQRKFLALGDTYTGGVTVAAGDLNGDGKAEVVVGNRPGRSPIVRTFNLAAFSQSSTLKLAPRLFEFVPFKSTDRGGVSVAVGNLRNDARAEILVGNGTGGQIQLFNPDGTRFKTINAYTDSSKNAPIYVAAKDTDSDDGGDLYAEVLAGQGVSGSSKRLKSFQPDATQIDNALQSESDFRHGFFIA
jgi:hypothetical protein